LLEINHLQHARPRSYSPPPRRPQPIRLCRPALLRAFPRSTACCRRTALCADPAMATAQLKVPTGIWSFYAERDQTRREHLLELQEQFAYQAFTVAHYRRFALEPATLADQTHQGMRLAQALVESLRKAKIIIPGVQVLERLCAEVIVRAQRRLYKAAHDSLQRRSEKQSRSAFKRARGKQANRFGLAAPARRRPFRAQSTGSSRKASRATPSRSSDRNRPYRPPKPPTSTCSGRGPDHSLPFEGFRGRTSSRHIGRDLAGYPVHAHRRDS
jgi:Domain of unknown function (DUF4158)